MAPRFAVNHSVDMRRADTILSRQIGFSSARTVCVDDCGDIGTRQLGATVTFAAQDPLRVDARPVPLTTRGQHRVLVKRVILAAAKSFGTEPRRVSVAAGRPALSNAIRHVLFMGARPDVGRITATAIRHVAGRIADIAIVTGESVGRQRTIDQFPGHAVGLENPAAQLTDAVTIRDNRTQPRPAGIRTARAVDAAPEADLKRLFRSELMRFAESATRRDLLAATAQTKAGRGILGVHRMISPFVAALRGARNTAGAFCCLNYSSIGTR